MEVVQVERRQRTTRSRWAVTTSYSRRSHVSSSLADAYLDLARIVNYYQNGAGSTEIVDNTFDSPRLNFSSLAYSAECRKSLS